MKNLFTILAAVILTVILYAQTPQKMSYQAVIRNSSNQLVVNKVVRMKISILQGSATGTAVYVETQTPTTNANGLVSIEIGGGTGFNTINWANGLYFIKTETDPLGGTNYSITGTSQLLSVPFALYAKTAENGFSGDYSDLINKPSLFDGNYNSLNNKPTLFDGTWNSLTGKPAFATIATSGSYNDLSNKPNIKDTVLTYANGSETKLTAGNDITVTGIGTKANPYIINSVPTHFNGELYGGGVVFYVDKTGQHGLICSMVDLSTGIVWTTTAYQSTTVPAPGALSDWNGQANTTAIVTQAGAGSNYAAGLCDAYTNVNYSTGVYSDWFLPSCGELNYLWNNIYEVQKALDSDGNAATTAISKSYYWASTECTNNGAWRFTFGYGGITGLATKVTTNFVRAVRAF